MSRRCRPVEELERHGRHEAGNGRLTGLAKSYKSWTYHLKRFGVLNRKKGGAKQDFAACA